MTLKLIVKNRFFIFNWEQISQYHPKKHNSSTILSACEQIEGMIIFERLPLSFFIHVANNYLFFYSPFAYIMLWDLLDMDQICMICFIWRVFLSLFVFPRPSFRNKHFAKFFWVRGHFSPLTNSPNKLSWQTWFMRR